MSATPDPLDDFLQHRPEVAVDARRKDATFEKTAAMLPRPKRARWPIAVAAAAGIFLALVSSYYAFIRPAPPLPVPTPDLVERTEKPTPPKAPWSILVETPAPAHPRDLEWSAFDADDDHDRVRLYFQAGDLFLEQHNDIGAAVRCYTQALHYCAANELEIDANDNWLVLALKRDHRKER